MDRLRIWRVQLPDQWKDHKLWSNRPPTGTVVGFAQNANGALWAATTSGLWKFDHSQWQDIGPESNLPAGPIREARFDQDGTFWILIGNLGPPQTAKLFYLRPGSSRFQTAANDLHTLGFTVDADGRVVTSSESKHFLEKSRGDSDDLPAAYPALRNGSNQILDRSQSVWIIPQEPILLRVAAWDGAIDSLNKASPRNSETYDLTVNNTAKLVDHEGNIWFGDPKGVHRFFYSPLIRQELPIDEG